MPGLAHLTEHMMFLGTALEPEEGAFKAFLQRNGGSSNAFTAMECTGFHFSVNPQHLDDALERFAAFFSCPLLREDSVEREMRAVDSEFNRNLQNDSRRLFQLIKSTSSEAHPFHKFSTGNLETLGGPSGASAQKAVRGFYESRYTADAMNLCVLGTESLDDLEALVLRHFGGLRAGATAEAMDVPPGPWTAAQNLVERFDTEFNPDS